MDVHWRICNDRQINRAAMLLVFRVVGFPLAQYLKMPLYGLRDDLVILALPNSSLKHHAAVDVVHREYDIVGEFREGPSAVPRWAVKTVEKVVISSLGMVILEKAPRSSSAADCH